MYKGIPIRLAADFSPETLLDKKEQYRMFKVLKERNFQPRILYLAKLLLKSEREIKSFPDKQKLKEVITPKSSLQETLKGFL